MDRGPWTGVTGAVSASDLDKYQWVGLITELGSCAFDFGSGIGGGAAVYRDA